MLITQLKNDLFKKDIELDDLRRDNDLIQKRNKKLTTGPNSTLKKALFVKDNHGTWNIQSECFISALHS